MLTLPSFTSWPLRHSLRFTPESQDREIPAESKPQQATESVELKTVSSTQDTRIGQLLSTDRTSVTTLTTIGTKDL